jgi:hypothetical protein
VSRWHVWRRENDSPGALNATWIDVGEWENRHEANDHAERVKAAAARHGIDTDAVVLPDGEVP